MKTITWKIIIKEDRIASLETVVGLPQDKVSSHLEIIGILENLKQKHLDKLNTLYQKTVKGNGDNGEDNGC